MTILDNTPVSGAIGGVIRRENRGCCKKVGILTPRGVENSVNADCLVLLNNSVLCSA